MPVYFKFQANDPHVTQKLPANTRQAVRTWQTSVYEFSFHEQHEAGWPVYVIETGQRGQRNRPKINLKNKQANQAAYLEGEFASNAIGEEAKAVVVANWAAFQRMADLYYEGEEVVKAPTAARFVQEFSCPNSRCKGRVVTVEIPNLATAGAPQQLGKCKQCKGMIWTAGLPRALKLSEKPDAPLNAAANKQT